MEQGLQGNSNEKRSNIMILEKWSIFLNKYFKIFDFSSSFLIIQKIVEMLLLIKMFIKMSTSKLILFSISHSLNSQYLYSNYLWFNHLSLILAMFCCNCNLRNQNTCTKWLLVYKCNFKTKCEHKSFNIW